jgi:serine/threonine-protein kinase
MDSDLTPEEALEIVKGVTFKSNGKYLTDIETAVFKGSWEKYTYEKMEEVYLYSHNTLREEGSKLWKKLSKDFGEKVSKTNLREAIKRRRYEKSQTDFYIERPPNESNCYNKILESGAVIRIKAPKSTGKTLLLNKVIAYAKEQDINFQAIILDFEQASQSVFTEYSKFLKWFCGTVGKLLELENKLNEYWDDDLYDEHTNTQNYFDDYLLKERTEPLILVLKNIDEVFEHENIRIYFCKLLRAWSLLHTNSDDLAEIWKQVRIILVHSTDIYGSLDLNFSPLDGVGLTVTLSDFTPEQIRKLEKRYQLQLTETEFNQFIAMFGGHPYFVQNALSYLKTGEHTLEHLLDIAPTEASPFKNHLRKHLEILQQNSELATAYYQVLSAISSVKISTPLTLKLESMGLVEVKKDDCVPRCGLYRQYFLSRIQPQS